MLFYNRSFYVGECCEPTTFQWVFYPHSLWFLLFLYLVAVLITCWYGKILFRCGFFSFVGWPCVKGGNNCDVGGAELCYMQCSLDQFTPWRWLTTPDLLSLLSNCSRKVSSVGVFFWNVSGGKASCRWYRHWSVLSYFLLICIETNVVGTDTTWKKKLEVLKNLRS